MKTALSGPMIIYGSRSPIGSGPTATGDANPDRAPSLVWGSMGLFDPRGGYNRRAQGAMGFSATSHIPVIDAVPATLSAVNIAASQSPGAGAINLVSTTGAGITVLAAALTVFPSGNTIPVGALAIDGSPALLSFGLTSPSTGRSPAVSLYDPTTLISRCVRIVSGGDDSGINFTVNGYDVYGYPITQTLAGAAIGTVTTTKAFKFIISVTHTGSVAGTVTIGTTDVYGIPLLTNTFGYVEISWNSTQITANTGYVAAVTTSPATASTGDVRGTYATQSASDGTKRLTIFATPAAGNLASASGAAVGLFGVTQV